MVYRSKLSKNDRTSNKLLLFLTIFLSIVFLSSTASGSIIIENNVIGVVDSINISKDGKIALLPAAEFIKKIEPSIRWNMLGKKQTFYTSKDTLILYKNNNFYKINRKLKQLYHAPSSSSGDFYLEKEELISIIQEISSYKVGWDPHIKVLTVDGDKEIIQPEVELTSPVIQSIKTVVIDPGHGGKDAGAVGPSDIYEKDVVLAISLELKRLLEEKTDIKVYMTRETDVFIPLRDRTKFANNKKADLFISVHANSIGGDKAKRARVKGYKMYFLSHAKNEDDKRAAMIENSVIELEDESQGSANYLENILNDMANNEYLKESQDISIRITEAFGKNITQTRKLHTGVGQANFWVLNGAFMPAVLVEAAFISNPNEEKLLKSSKFQKKVAKAISDAVVEFKVKYEGN